MERKKFKADNITIDDKGHINFRFAKLGVVDKDGDMIFPGSIQSGKKVLLSAWNHTSWNAGLSIGKGTISEIAGYLVFDGDFNLKTEIGREHYETVKFNEDLQEYSFGYDAKTWDYSQDDSGKRIRNLKELDVFEASPVLLGAGIETGTNSIKATKEESESKTYFDHAEMILESVKDFVERSQSIANLREEKGKEPVSEKNIEHLEQVRKALDQASKEIKRILTTEDDSDDDEVYVQTQLIMQQLVS